MLAPKQKREHARKPRHRRQYSWVWFLVLILIGMLIRPMMSRGSGVMNGEQWTDLFLVMAMFCCAIALFYQLGLRLLAQDRQPQSVEIYEQVQENISQNEDV